MNAVRMMIVAHVPLASALREAALHAFPECAPDIEAVDVTPQSSAEEIARRVAAGCEAAKQPTLILVDAVGATPANAVLAVLAMRQAPDVAAVSGVNVPMLWRALCYRSSCESLDELADRAIEGGVRGIMRLPTGT